MALATSVAKTNNNNIENELQNTTTTTVSLDEIWAGSTHSYLFSLESSCAEKFVAIIALSFQYLMYVLMMVWTTTAHKEYHTVYWQQYHTDGEGTNERCIESEKTLDDFYCLTHTDSTAYSLQVMVIVALL
eukprot:360815_1